MTLRQALRKNVYIVGVAVFLAGIRIGAVLFVPPVVGLANNGDFERVMARVGLGYLTERYEERYWSWALTKFSILETSAYQTGHITSETPLAALAVLATRLASRTPILDIRALGAIHALLFLCAIALLVRACRDLAPAVQWTVAGTLVFCLADVGYVALFNSLYGQTSSLLSLLWLTGIAALAIRRGSIGPWQLLAYFLAAAWFVGSKPQECLQAPLLAWFGVRLASPPANRRFGILPAAALAVALSGFAIWFYSRIPRLEIHDVGVYHTVFMDLLPSSSDPAADLRELGLDPEMAKYSGRHAYAAGSPLGDPRFRVRFFERFGYAKLLGFYVAHPARLLDRLQRAGRLAFRLRPTNLGNFDQSSGAPPLSQLQHASTWSRWRLELGRRGLLWIVLLLGGNALVACRGWRASVWRGRLFREGVALLALMGVLEFAVCSLADYLGDLPRHLYVFQAIFDVLLVVDVGWGAQTLSRRLGRGFETEVPDRGVEAF